MSLSVRSIRDRVASAITTTLAGDGWRESPYSYDMYPLDSQHLAHLSFAVGVPSTTPASLDRQSGRGGATTRTALSTTACSIRWSHYIRGDAQVADYSSALDAETALTAAVLGIDRDPDLTIRLARIPIRSVVGDGTYFLGQIDFEVLHRLPLE